MSATTSVADRILDKISQADFERRRFFLASDLVGLGSTPSVHMALSRLCAAGYFCRVSAGLYERADCLPDDQLNWLDELASVAARRGACEVHTGGLETALLLEFPVHLSRRHTYISNGGSSYLFWKGHELEIRRVRPALYAEEHSKVGRIIQAAYWLGREFFIGQWNRAEGERLYGDIPGDVHRLLRSRPGPNWLYKAVIEILARKRGLIEHI